MLLEVCPFRAPRGDCTCHCHTCDARSNTMHTPCSRGDTRTRNTTHHAAAQLGSFLLKPSGLKPELP